MWDQVLALEFVRDNIAQFGGDPDLVTIFGQSAGASSTALHMMSPASQGRHRPTQDIDRIDMTQQKPVRILSQNTFTRIAASCIWYPVVATV